MPAPPPAITCPDWCARPAGHDLGVHDRDPDTGEWRRFHLGALLRDELGGVLQREQFEVVGRRGALRRDPEHVVVIPVSETADAA